jgi:hypothetical protein
MADQKSLRAIGLGFAAVTTAVTLIAAVMVAEAPRGPAGPERAQTAKATASL